MKYVKIIGLAAMTAAAVMAVGAATSSATVFCKAPSTETCGEKYPLGTFIDVTSEGTLVIETLSGTVVNTCLGVSVEKSLENVGGATLTVKGSVAASDIHFKECTKTTDTIEGGEGEVHWISGTDNGTGTAKGGGVTINTIFGSCVYGLGSEMKDWGVLTGGEHPSETVENIAVLVAGNLACPTQTRVTGKLVLTSPERGYVAAS